MFLAEPPRTPYDVNFTFAGFPVRVHPFFWLAALILGSRRMDDGFYVLIWVGSMFFSILVHELGHAFTMRRFGESPRIVLYMMGGLAIADSGPFGTGFTKGRNSFDQIIISAAGPAAQLALAGIVIGLLIASGGTISLIYIGGVFPFPIGQLPENDLNTTNTYLQELVLCLLWINIFWAVLNLLPVYPLDGGQIARELFTKKDPWEGVRKSLWLSVYSGAAIAIFALIVMQSLFMALMFGVLAYSSYMNIQQISGGGFGGGGPWGGGGGRP